MHGEDDEFLAVGGEQAADGAGGRRAADRGSLEARRRISRAIAGAGMRHRGADDVGRRLGALEGADHAASVHDEDAVAHAEHLGQFARDHDHRRALPGELAHQRVDFRLGADIDAARRLVHDQHRELVATHFASTTFCWLPAGELAGALLGPRARMPKRWMASFASASSRLAVDEGRLRDARQQRHRHVLADRLRLDEALQAAILGHIGDAEIARLLRAPDRDRLAVEQDLARGRRR